jgi:hypothetical protein
VNGNGFSVSICTGDPDHTALQFFQHYIAFAIVADGFADVQPNPAVCHQPKGNANEENDHNTKNKEEFAHFLQSFLPLCEGVAKPPFVSPKAVSESWCADSSHFARIFLGHLPCEYSVEKSALVSVKGCVDTAYDIFGKHFIVDWIDTCQNSARQSELVAFIDDLVQPVKRHSLYVDPANVQHLVSVVPFILADDRANGVSAELSDGDIVPFSSLAQCEPADLHGILLRCQYPAAVAEVTQQYKTDETEVSLNQFLLFVTQHDYHSLA